MKKLICTAALLAALAGGAFAAPVLKVGTESTYPPYEFIGPSGKLEGFDVELAEAVAAKLGMEVQWQDMAFDALIPALLTKKIDMIAAGMSATEERAKRVAFSIPYEESVSAFITRPDGPKSIEELKGKIVTVQLGTIQDTFADSMEGVTVKKFQKYDDCVREVVLGRADASLMDVPVAKDYVKSEQFGGKIALFEQKISTGDKALAVSKDAPELKEKVDAALKAMEADGSLQALKDKWFK